MAGFVLLSFTLPLLAPFFSGSNSRDNAPTTADARPQVPDFVLPSADGLDVRLADIAQTHSAVVVVFHRGPNCSVCRDQIAEFSASYTQLQQQGAEVLAISVGTQQDATRIARRTRAEFPVLYDSSGIAITAYGLEGQLDSEFTTAIFVIDRDLRLIGVPVGTKGPEVLPVELILDALREFNGSDATSS